MNDEFHLVSDKEIPTGVPIEVKFSDGTRETMTLISLPVMPLKGLKRWKHRLLSFVKSLCASNIDETPTIVAWRLAESEFSQKE